MSVREHLFKGFSPSPAGLETIIINGEYISGSWCTGAYLKHQPIMRSPVVFAGDKPRGEKDYVHLIIYDGMADWNLPRPVEAKEVIPETVSEYTGQKDSTGVKIFENHKVMDAGGTVGTVAWIEDRGFCVKYDDGVVTEWFDGQYYTVQGTIFDATLDNNFVTADAFEENTVAETEVFAGTTSTVAAAGEPASEKGAE